MYSNGTLFCFVNLPGGYANITLDGVPIPEIVDQAIQPVLQEAVRTRGKASTVQPLGPDLEVRAEAIYDAKGEDDVGRKGMVFMIGAYGAPGVKLRLPSAEGTVALLDWRAAMIRDKLPADFAHYAFCGLLNHMVQRLEPAAATAVAAPAPAEPVRLPKHGILPASRRAQEWGALVRKYGLSAILLIGVGLSLILAGFNSYRLQKHIAEHGQAPKANDSAKPKKEKPTVEKKQDQGEQAEAGNAQNRPNAGQSHSQPERPSHPERPVQASGSSTGSRGSGAAANQTGNQNPGRNPPAPTALAASQSSSDQGGSGSK